MYFGSKKNQLVMLVKIAAVIGFIELIIMMAFEFLPKMPAVVEGFLDAGVLSILSAIVIYGFIFKPRIRQAQSAAEVVFNNLVEGYVAIDQDGKLVEFNAAAQSILGLTPEQLLNRTILDSRWKLTYEDGSPLPIELNPSALAMESGRMVRNMVLGLETPLGEKRLLMVNSIPQFLSGDTRPVRVITTFTDITSQRLSELETEKVNLMLQAAASVLSIGTSETGAGVIRGDERFAKIFELNPEQATLPTLNFEEFILPEDRVRRQVVMAEVIHSKAATFKNAFGIRTGKGNVKYLLEGGNCHYDRGGNLDKIIGAYVDFTDYKKIQSQSEQIFDVISQNMIYSATDRSGLIIDTNSGFERISGYTREELLGRDHRIVNSGYHDKDFFKKMWDTVLAGQVWTGEVCNRRKDGAHYWVQAVVSPVIGIDGTIEKILSIRFEVTDRKNAEKLLLQSAKMASLGEMASGVAHEINNPLAIIQGKAGQIRRRLEKGEMDKDRFLEDARKIEDTVERIAKIIRGLRAFSRNSEGDAMASVDLSEIIFETTELCKERFKKADVALTVECQTQAQIECRTAQIEQALLNLLSNAFDAVQNLDVKWVKLKVTPLSDKVEISVTDSGTGIPQHLVDRIMEPFFTTKGVGHGTGLGLSISKGLIEEHQGELRYDYSSPHTCFVITLPYKQIPIFPSQKIEIGQALTERAALAKTKAPSR